MADVNVWEGVGAPTRHRWQTGDIAIDQTGGLWRCTRGGTPGTWGSISAAPSSASAWVEVPVSADPGDWTLDVADSVGTPTTVGSVLTAVAHGDIALFTLTLTGVRGPGPYVMQAGFSLGDPGAGQVSSARIGRASPNSNNDAGMTYTYTHDTGLFEAGGGSFDATLDQQFTARGYIDYYDVTFEVDGVTVARAAELQGVDSGATTDALLIALIGPASIDLATIRMWVPDVTAFA